jgi:hypothetical protein
MKTIAKKFNIRTIERGLEGNYLLDLLRYLKRWIIHYSGATRL